jgi:hypothetical protein
VTADLAPRDQALLDRARAELDTVDPVPPSVVEAAKSSLTWLTVDAELATLSEDAAPATSGLRTEAAARSLTFECSTGVVVLEVTSSGDERRLVGQTDRAAAVEVRHPGGVLRADTDEHGRFRAAGVHAGPVSLRCTFADAPDAPIVTSWVVV